MDEIAALQAQLAAVQASGGGASYRVSDRNCIELLSKVQELGLVDKLVYTNSGRLEFVTPRRLKFDVHDEVLMRGGRVNVTDLAPALCVDLQHIETVLPEILEEKRDVYSFINGEIIAEYYLDSVVEEVVEDLHESAAGIKSLADVATEFGLPIQLVSNAIGSPSRQHVLHGIKVEGGRLYTDGYTARCLALVRGTLLAATMPFTVGEIAAHLSIRSALVAQELESLVKDGLLVGQTSGRGGDRMLFTPDTFAVSRERAVMAFFKANGYLEFSRMKQYMIADPQKYVHHLVGADAGVVFGDVFLGNQILEQARASLEEAMQSDSWVAAGMLFSFELDQAVMSDVICMLVSSCSRGKTSSRPAGEADSAASEPVAKGTSKSKVERAKKASALVSDSQDKEAEGAAHVVLGGKYVVSSSLVDRVRDAFRKDAEERAQRLAVSGQQLVMPISSSRQDAQNAEVTEPSKAAKKKKGTGKKVSNASPGIHSTEINLASNPILAPPLREKCIEMLAEHEILSASFQADVSGFEPEDGDIFELLFDECVAPLIETVYRKAFVAVVEESERKKRVRDERIQRAVSETLSRIEFCQKGIQALRLPGETAAAASIAGILTLHAKRTLCVDLLTILCRKSNVDSGVDVLDDQDDGGYNPAASGNRFSPSQITENISKIPVPWKTALTNLWKLIKSDERGSLDEIIFSFDEASEVPFGMPKHFPLDKKRERALFDSYLEHTNAIMCQTSAESPAREILVHASALLLARLALKGDTVTLAVLVSRFQTLVDLLQSKAKLCDLPFELSQFLIAYSLVRCLPRELSSAIGTGTEAHESLRSSGPKLGSLVTESELSLSRSLAELGRDELLAEWW
ncbi:E3 UFM1-protein ligase 1-like [Porphyridium purpureum]|uniref:E3 UFM1-protein ligase 1-like n=1 Tax=Porphyridium purpureum TaxID=35688 RepID=A0A5J4Z882_PORPP|nr:E3 UFM1-protein ligase 1-like [Porphyridium purpureum]|eukprot:POR9555..scf295_1